MNYQSAPVFPPVKHIATLSAVSLSAGINTITHNLNLADFNVGFTAYNTVTGEQISLKRGTVFSANTFQVITALPIIVDINITGAG